MPRNPKEKLVGLVVGEVSLVDDGDNPPAHAVLWKRRSRTNRPGMRGYDPGKRRRDLDKQTRRVSGEDLPSRAFAFVPDPDLPSTWRLPLFDTASAVSSNSPSVVKTAQAAQALSSRGFRGQRVRVPDSARPGVVRRVRSAWLKARRDADQDVSNDDLPTVLKGLLLKLMVETLEQRTGGVEKHTHQVELPDGPIGAGLFVTFRSDGHDHDLEIPNDLAVGETIELVTKSANQEPPEGVAPHVHRVRITVMDRVERRMQQEKEKLEALGIEISDEVEKRLFEEIRAETVRDQAADAVMRRLGDFAQSVREIFFMLNDDGEQPSSAEVESGLRESLGQFVENMDAELPEILAGRIAKLRDALDEEDEDETFALAIEDEVTKWLNEPPPTASGSGSPSPGAGELEQQGEPMDPKTLDKSKLDGLDKDTRAIVDKALEQAEQVDTLVAKVAELEEKLTTKAKPDAGGADDDPYASLPTEVQAALNKRDEELAEARAENLELRQKSQREAIEKRCTFKSISGGDELVDVMLALSEDNRAKLEGVLKAADEAASKGGITDPIGDEAGGDAGAGSSAYAAIEAAGAELRKANPALTIEKAKAEAIRLQPELYENYRKELAEQMRH